MRGIERHQLPPRRLQNATSSPSVVSPSPFNRRATCGRSQALIGVIGVRHCRSELRGVGAHPERHRREQRSAMLPDRRAQMIRERQRH
jgi:hypothetical protein